MGPPSQVTGGQVLDTIHLGRVRAEQTAAGIARALREDWYDPIYRAGGIPWLDEHARQEASVSFRKGDGDALAHLADSVREFDADVAGSISALAHLSKARACVWPRRCPCAMAEIDAAGPRGEQAVEGGRGRQEASRARDVTYKGLAASAQDGIAYQLAQLVDRDVVVHAGAGH